MHVDIHRKLQSSAQVHLYDHLTRRERDLRLPSSEDKKPLTAAQKASTDAFREAENNVARWGVEGWAERLLTSLREYQSTINRHRPFVFICHSTGGNVLKYALTRKLERESNEIAKNTIGITFFAVPHHGSSVLSEDEYVKTVQDHLRLKWRMSKRLRRDFRLRDDNEELNQINQMFVLDMLGIKVHSYAEMADSYLTVLTSDDLGLEGPTVVRYCIVDSRSGKLSRDQVPFEDEEFMQLDMDHIGLPRFVGQDDQYNSYLDAIGALVNDYNESDRKAYQNLTKAIMTEVKVHVHQFYGDQKSMKILLTKPTLETFLEIGPAECMKERIEGRDEDVAVAVLNPNSRERPKIGVQPPSDTTLPQDKTAPSLKVETVDGDDPSDGHRPNSQPTLAPPQISISKSILTPFSPKPLYAAEPGSGNLGPTLKQSAQAKVVSFRGETRDRDFFTEPHRAARFQLPYQAPNRFRWIHVPFTHPGWVHQVLGRISREKGSSKLHEKVLMNKMWFSQHNQSRHASPHARFVRPSVKCLHPEGVEAKPPSGIATPSSACDDVQFIVYMPYLHWDSFKNMKKRADIISQRQNHTGPIPRDIESSSSVEHR